MIGFLAAGALTQVFALVLHRLKDCRSHVLKPDGAITKTHITYQIARALTPSVVDDPLLFWINLISALLIGLSDQQVLMGLVVLAIVSGVQGASYSMLIAQFISFFTLITHAATFSSLRPYFRRFRWLTLIRVAVMLTAYVLWILANNTVFVVLEEILARPEWLDADSTETYTLMHDALSVLFAIECGLMTWVYLSMIPSLYLSDELIKVRKIVARWPLRKANIDTTIISDWLQERQMGRSINRNGEVTQSSTIGHIILTPYAMFCRLYLRTKSKAARALLWLVAELFFPWMVIPAVLLLLFVGLLIFLCYAAKAFQKDTEWNYGQVLTLVMLVLPFWSMICLYAGMYYISILSAYVQYADQESEQKEDAIQEKKEMAAQGENVTVDSKAWADQPHSLGNSLDTGDLDTPGSEYRPVSRNLGRER
jgi:uncharacterized membrane protein